ncbi:hypothetical protein [Pseudomonas sp. Tri1]|uniref:hypothetical protein n=1 Tax=Pseudomonas sp. Tri1 TaxID=2823875 RepID=UPI001B334B15|nr:hypothetical protein [Pseudomonas sp. Tri1]
MNIDQAIYGRRSTREYTTAAVDSADQIQHQLIRLDTLVRLHFDQEEELFRYLDWR